MKMTEWTKAHGRAMRALEANRREEASTTESGIEASYVSVGGRKLPWVQWAHREACKQADNEVGKHNRPDHLKLAP